MNYYYLDENRRICGPYSLPQMSVLLLNGTISRSTLCAAEGEKTWRPISEQSWLRGEASESVSAAVSYGSLGNCPYCGAVQEGYKLSPHCPSCGAAQAPKSSSMWSFFCLALRRLCCLKGRSQRKEYWAYVIYFILFLVLLSLASSVMMLFFCPDKFHSLDWVLCYSLLGGLIGLLTYPLLVRRLHDIGWSGWWAVLPFLFYIYGTYVSIYAEVMTPAPEVSCTIEEDTGTMSAEEFHAKYPTMNLAENGEVRYMVRREVHFTKRKKDMEKRMEQPLGSSPGAVMLAKVLSYLSYPVSIFVLIVSCLDTKRGANKYGPSSKYPHG